jgi:hypothetical protein
MAGQPTPVGMNGRPASCPALPCVALLILLSGSAFACDAPVGEIQPAPGELLPPVDPGPGRDEGVDVSQQQVLDGAVTRARPEVGIVRLPGSGCTGTPIATRPPRAGVRPARSGGNPLSRPDRLVALSGVGAGGALALLAVTLGDGR